MRNTTPKKKKKKKSKFFIEISQKDISEIEEIQRTSKNVSVG